REGARMLALREIREDPERTLSVASFRDPRESRPLLEKAAFATAAEDRARALVLLIECTGRYRSGMKETLAFLARIKNEQDPVRLPGFDALVKCPPSAFADADMEGLAPLVEAVVEARDTSSATRTAVERLASALCRAGARDAKGARFRFGVETLHRLA